MDRYQSTILCHFIGLADSHITHPHLSQTFTIVVTVVEIAGFRVLMSVPRCRVEAGGWVCAAASSLPDCFEAGCLGVYEVRPRGCSCPLSSAAPVTVQCLVSSVCTSSVSLLTDDWIMVPICICNPGLKY